VEARVIFAAAPAMGHNQVNNASFFAAHLDKYALVPENENILFFRNETQANIFFELQQIQ
jgi:hypothetical protein